MGRLIVAIVALIWSTHPIDELFAQNIESVTYEDAEGNRMRYRLYKPAGYDQPGREFPLVVWLHGGGRDSEPQGLIDAVTSERFAAFLVSPQSLSDDTWTTCNGATVIPEPSVDCPPGDTLSMQSVIGILDEIQTEFSVDVSRRFVTGRSAGGVGAFEALIKHPGLFSAAVSMVGGYDPDLITDQVAETRIWAVHSHNDNTLSPYWSRSSVQKVNEFGGSVIYLEPPGDHNSPTTYSFFEDANDELYPWLFEADEPSLARLLYDPSSGNVSVDAERAPGGVISKMTLSSQSDLFPAAISEINGDELTISSKSIRYTASDGGFGGIVDLGNILTRGMDFTELHEALSVFRYDSPAASPRNRTFRLAVVPPGDFDTNGILDITDINQLVWEIAADTHNSDFDLNNDDLVNESDLTSWVKDLRGTWFGDANVDGEFNSADLVAIFTAGKYEQDADANWSEGDWTGDHRFDSADLVAAFTDGGYEQGPLEAVRAVPEPSSFLMVMAGLIGIAMRRRTVR